MSERRRSMMGGKKEPSVKIDYSTVYFTLKALESGTFSHSNVAVQYSVDDGDTWNNLAADSSTPTVPAGTKVMFKGTITPNGTYGVGKFNGTGNFEAEGNVMSLLYGDNFEGQVDLTGKNYAFYRMFYQSTTLKKAKNLILPATTLAEGCYYDMFRQCSSLTTAPALPAKILKKNCYNYMFYNCSSLNYIKASFISYPGTSYTTSWVSGVAATGTFVKNEMAKWSSTGVHSIPSGWTVLTSVIYDSFTPSISLSPAGYVTFSANSKSYIGLKRKSSYQTLYISKNGTLWHTMSEGETFAIEKNENFYVCGVLSSGNTASNYTNIIVGGNVESSGNCNAIWNYSDLNASLLADCGYLLFAGSRGLTSAPSLPSTTLASECYRGMFNGCSSLITAPALPATTLTIRCYAQMFMQCSSLITAPELPATTLIESCYSDMFNNCTSLTTAPELPATTLATNCYSGMFSSSNVLPDCTNIDFTSSSVVASGGLAGLFYGTNVTDEDLNRILPKNSNNKYCLPATTLATNCYRYMFGYCKKLKTAPELPAPYLVEGCYNYMFMYCQNLNYIKVMANPSNQTKYTSIWVSGVASSGTFVMKSGARWTTGTSGVPSGWTVETAAA